MKRRRNFGRRPGRGEPKEIAFTVDKNGKPIAYNMHGRGSGFTTSPVRMNMDEAKLMIASGEAVRVPYTRNPSGLLLFRTRAAAAKYAREHGAKKFSIKKLKRGK